MKTSRHLRQTRLTSRAGELFFFIVPSRSFRSRGRCGVHAPRFGVAFLPKLLIVFVFVAVGVGVGGVVLCLRVNPFGLTIVAT